LCLNKVATIKPTTAMIEKMTKMLTIMSNVTSLNQVLVIYSVPQENHILQNLRSTAMPPLEAAMTGRIHAVMAHEVRMFL
jgi:hypothetical protein